MEFLDSLDLDTINKKSHRVRSWYLYEQFKSLEKSQLDAAQKLKDRSYQERILRQELSERRARRKLYDQFGLCQSESRLKRDKSGSNYAQRTTVSTSDDDFFENFYRLQDDEQVTQVTGTNEFAGDGEGDIFSQDDLSASRCCLNNYVTVEDQNKEDNGSCVGSITSVVENLKPDEFIRPDEMEFKRPEEIKYVRPEEMEFVRPEEMDFMRPEEMEYVTNSIDEEITNSLQADLNNSIAEDINMQLDSVQEDIMCLENIAKFEDVDKISVQHSFTKAAVRELNVQVSKKADQECNAIAIWSRLVSFAYQVVQLNHGNCYCDYSSQFLTAVLACDVLRRGVNRMCNILQPYVSPIEFAETDESTASLNLNFKRKKSIKLRKCKKICEIKPLSQKSKKHTKTRRSEIKCPGRHGSHNVGKHCCTESLTNGTDATERNRSASEPWCGYAKVYHYREEISSRSSSSGNWSDLLKEKPKVSRRQCYKYQNRGLNPMLKIAHCIDSILKDIDDPKHDM